MGSAQSFCLKILVAKEENKVILVESDKDFIEVLFSFMIMPIGSMVKHTRNCLLGDIGCLNNLYTSVNNLETNLFQNEKFRDILLNPRSAAEIYCNNLVINLIKNGRDGFYVCDNKNCKVISYYNLGKCRCGKGLRYKQIKGPNARFLQEEGSFLKSSVRFMITDDLKVMPVANMADLTSINGLEKYGKIQVRTITIGRPEVLNLLKCSLRSRTPLSETFLEPSINNSSNELFDIKCVLGGMNPSLRVKSLWKKKTKISFKLIFDKINNIALYAVVHEDFVNLLFTFLTFPLGYIFNKFPFLSFDGCIGNLHKSIKDTKINIFLSKERKEILLNPKLAPGLAYNNNLIGIKEANIPSDCSAFSNLLEAKNKDLKPNKGNQKAFEGFIKGPSSFLVTDHLDIKPLSPISIKLLLDNLMVPVSDIEEQEVILDDVKAMHLLAASLATEHALTSTFLDKEAHVDGLDCMDFLQLMWGEKGIGSKGDEKLSVGKK